MEAENSHNLPSASCRAKETAGIIQFKSEGLRIWKSENEEADVQEEEKWMSQFQQRQWILSSIFLLYPGPQQIEWCPPAPGRAICFT